MPMPSSMRPFEMLSRIAKSSASRIGWANGASKMSVDRRMRDVRAATAPAIGTKFGRWPSSRKWCSVKPSEIEAQLVGHLELIERLGVHLGQRHLAAGRAAQIVDDTESQG